MTFETLRFALADSNLENEAFRLCEYKDGEDGRRSFSGIPALKFRRYFVG